MMEARGIDTEPNIRRVGAEISAESVALAERARLAVAGRPDGAVKGLSRSIYGMLREAIEGLNMFVFQYPLATEGACGLSMAETDPRAILVNSRDVGPAKAFTLLHEYGHVLLGAGGICDEHGALRPDSDKRRTEAWCNRFAASFMMPKDGFAAERRRLEGLSDSPFEVVGDLAKKFKVGKYAAAVRAADVPGSRHGAAYGRVLGTVAGRYSRRQKTKDKDKDKDGDEDGGKAKKGGPRHLDVLVSQMGLKFIGLAVSSHKRGVISALDLGNYLDIDLKHLDSLCKRANMAE